jgi:hypothetical protein
MVHSLAVFVAVPVVNCSVLQHPSVNLRQHNAANTLFINF